MRASEGKKTCLSFVCNARLISMKLPMEENANTFMMELHMKELVAVVFGEYNETEDELNRQHCCSAFLFFVFLLVAVVLSSVVPIVV
jgi:hypothetical protein